MHTLCFIGEYSQKVKRVVLDMISYAPLWKTMENRGISTYFLIEKKGFSSNTISRLRHNMHMNTDTMERLCKILECTPNDIIEFLPDEKEK